jgi:hypothetical protein
LYTCNIRFVDLEADERIILKCISKDQDGMRWVGFICISIVTGAGLLGTP